MTHHPIREKSRTVYTTRDGVVRLLDGGGHEQRYSVIDGQGFVRLHADFHSGFQAWIDMDAATARYLADVLLDAADSLDEGDADQVASSRMIAGMSAFGRARS